MKFFHKINFLAHTYRPKYETTCSLLCSIISYIFTIIFAVYTCYSELICKKTSNIAFTGIQKSEMEYHNESLKIGLDFNMHFFCDFFYVTSENEKKPI